MRIACPSCAAEYEVPESRLTRRKLVRCARCGAEWIPAPTDGDVVPPQEPAEPPPSDPQAAPWPPMTAMERLAASPPRGHSPAILLGAWVLTLVLLTGTLAATVIWREAVMRAWPPSTLILAPFGHAAADPAQITAGKTE
jgi:predicted Zn finger-like uncharacterized protein